MGTPLYIPTRHFSWNIYYWSKHKKMKMPHNGKQCSLIYQQLLSLFKQYFSSYLKFQKPCEHKDIHLHIHQMIPKKRTLKSQMSRIPNNKRICEIAPKILFTRWWNSWFLGLVSTLLDEPNSGLLCVLWWVVRTLVSSVRQVLALNRLLQEPSCHSPPFCATKWLVHPVRN